MAELGWGMSVDNIKGLVLALSSSLFIGSSFIIKKKGLKKAGSSGLRAGMFFLFEIGFWSFCPIVQNQCDFWDVFGSCIFNF